MKIKSDFVTNSSSTSFILTCQTDIEEKQEFINKLNKLLQEYSNRRKWDEEFQEPPFITSEMVTQVGPKRYAIRDFVAVFSGEADIPQYIMDFFLDTDSAESKALAEAGIVLVNKEIKNLNE